jgi:hypothetical protein
METGQVNSWFRHQGNQPGDEIQWLKYEQLNATNFSSWQASHLTLRKPCSSLPHFKYSSNGAHTLQWRLALLGGLGVRAIPWFKQIMKVFVCGLAQRNGHILKLL